MAKQVIWKSQVFFDGVVSHEDATRTRSKSIFLIWSFHQRLRITTAICIEEVKEATVIFFLHHLLFFFSSSFFAPLKKKYSRTFFDFGFILYLFFYRCYYPPLFLFQFIFFSFNFNPLCDWKGLDEWAHSTTKKWIKVETFIIWLPIQVWGADKDKWLFFLLGTTVNM